MDMTVGIYAVYDKKSKLSGPIFQARTVDEAKRMIVCSLHETSVLVQFPRDYALVHVADYDQIDCCVELVGDKIICSVADIIPEKFRQFDLTGGEMHETPVEGTSKEAKRLFSKTAAKTRGINLRAVPMRGGFRI